MKAFKDGNAVCVTLDDFKNLQESPAIFLDDKLAEKIERAKFDLSCLDLDDYADIAARLVMGANAQRMTVETLPIYQVFAVIHSECLTPAIVNPAIFERIEPLGNGTSACWSRPTSCVDFMDFERKGSVSVFGEIIHDDYRVGDCRVYRIGKQDV